MSNRDDFVGHADMQEMLLLQRAAFSAEGVPSIKQRKATLAKLRSAVLEYRARIEEAISVDFGNRSKHETAIMEFAGVVQSIDYLVGNLRRFMRREKRHVGLFYRPGRAYVEYQPKGVVGIMAPWNYPFSLTIIPLATALAAGNRAMIKPSELTPATSDLIRRMLCSRFDVSEVATVLGGAEVGAAFSGLPFDHLLFTGSTAVGRKVMRAASDNLVPLTLELGGKSPVVVGHGDVTEKNVASIVYGKLSNAGQTCVAPDFAFVHEDDLDRFVSMFVATVSRFYPDGMAGIDYTSIISDRHHARLAELVKDAESRGAKVIRSGVVPSAADHPRAFEPILLTNVDDEMAVMREEIFGPLLPIRTYRTLEEVIKYINDRPRPLALYYFGENDAECRKLISRTTSGNVGINNTLMHVAQDDLPFGGIGPSGMGAYHGIEGFKSMSHAKGIYEQGKWSLPRLLHAPFGRIAEMAIRVVLGNSK